MPGDAREPQRRGCRAKLHVDRRHLEYILKGELTILLFVFPIVLAHQPAHVDLWAHAAAPRFVESGEHIFARISTKHGLVHIGVDPNFKVGAKSKKGPHRACAQLTGQTPRCGWWAPRARTRPWPPRSRKSPSCSTPRPGSSLLT